MEARRVWLFAYLELALVRSEAAGGDIKHCSDPKAIMVYKFYYVCSQIKSSEA